MGYGEWIRRQRRRLDLTQRELGQRVGATDSYISHLENELRIPSWELSLALVRAFGVGDEEEGAFLDLVDSARLRRARGRLPRRDGAASSELVGIGRRRPRVRLVDPRGGEELGSLAPESGVSCLGAAPGGGSVALGAEDGRVMIWRLDGDGLEDLGGHAERINALAYTPDGDTLVSAGQDGALKLWDACSGQERCTITGETPAAAVAVSADGERVAAGYADGTVRIWGLADGERLQKLDTRSGAVRALAFSPDGGTLACGGDGAGLWDLKTGELARALRGLGRRVHAVAFSADGSRLVAVGDESWKLWGQSGPEEEQAFPVPREGMVTAGFLPSTGGAGADGPGEERLLTVSRHGGVVIRAIDGENGPERQTNLGMDSVAAASLSPDGTALGVVGSAALEEDELDTRELADRLGGDPELASAFRDLLTAYSDPRYRQAALTTLRSLAQAAEPE